MKLLCHALLAASLFSAACAVEASDAFETATETDQLDDGKADQADIPTVALDVAAPRDPATARVGVIKSEAAWRTAFGYDAPAELDFDQQWVALYVAGAQPTGGHRASITTVRLSDTGRSLKVGVRLETPGTDCVTTQATQTPFAAAVFARPSEAPSTNRYVREVLEVACDDGGGCAGDVELVPVYFDSTDGLECLEAEERCLTNDPGACPQLTPPPSWWCEGGVVERSTRYAPSADGMLCAMPVLHCLTNDLSACPQRGPLPPDFCADGTIDVEDAWVASADGKECAFDRVHCLTTDDALCSE